MNATKNTYNAPSLGCYCDSADGQAHNDREVLRLALGFGWDCAEAVTLLEPDDTLDDDGEADRADAIAELTQDAEDFLNGLETRPYTSWYWSEGNFGLWANVEGAKEDGIWRSGDEDASEADSDYPADDFRGEWLHVNDHGNCTLYVREDCATRADGAGVTNFNDREIWSVV